MENKTVNNQLSSFIELCNEPSFLEDIIKDKYSKNPLTINIYPFLFSIQFNVFKNNSYDCLKMNVTISSSNVDLGQVCPTKIIDSLKNKHCQDVRINLSCN